MINLDVIVVGELNVDALFSELQQGFPVPGSDKPAGNFVLELGSASAMVAANLSSLGLSVGFVGKTGNDQFGRFVLDSLQDCGVDTSQIQLSKNIKTGITAVLNHGDERASVTYKGDSKSWRIEDIDLDNLKGARHLHVSADYLRPELSKDCRDIFLSAKKKGISTSLDANWESAQYWEESSFDVLAAVDVFFLNESEAMTISGSDDLTVALELLSSYVNTVVIKRGHSGCIARQDSTSAQVDGLPIVPVDIVGVGSGFNAGFIAKYLMGCSLNICLNFGNLCGAYSTQKSGGIAAFQDQSSFKQFLETYSTEESRVS